MGPGSPDVRELDVSLSILQSVFDHNDPGDQNIHHRLSGIIDRQCVKHSVYNHIGLAN